MSSRSISTGPDVRDRAGVVGEQLDFAAERHVEDAHQAARRLGDADRDALAVGAEGQACNLHSLRENCQGLILLGGEVPHHDTSFLAGGREPGAVGA